MKNNLGQELTEDQATYFQYSKVKDNSGNLLVCYHSTPIADFLAFDPRSKDRGYYKYKDKVINFFASSRQQAKSYGGFEDEVDLDKTKDNKGGGIYSVYLDIQKPYLYDAEGASWRALHDAGIRKDILEKYNKFLEEWKKVAFDYIDDHLSILNRRLQPIGYILKKYEGRSYDLFSLVEGGHLDPVDNRMSVADDLVIVEDLLDSDEWKEDIMGDVGEDVDPYSDTSYFYSTNDIVNYAINKDIYDGVIIKNVHDNGQYGWADASTIYITIKSPTQIKSILNKHPSRNRDNINEAFVNWRDAFEHLLFSYFWNSDVNGDMPIGKSFLFPNGKFLDVECKEGNTSYEKGHWEVEEQIRDWFGANGEPIKYEQLNKIDSSLSQTNIKEIAKHIASNPYDGGSPTLEPLFNVIRCNSKRERYLVLSQKLPSNAQLNSLRRWLDLYFVPNGPGYVGLPLYVSPNDQKYGPRYGGKLYDPSKTTVDELIKIIKRFYSSGKLFESKTTGVGEILYEFSNKPENAPEGWVRLYHQTDWNGLSSILTNGYIKADVWAQEEIPGTCSDWHYGEFAIGFDWPKDKIHHGNKIDNIIYQDVPSSNFVSIITNSIVGKLKIKKWLNSEFALEEFKKDLNELAEAKTFVMPADKLDYVKQNDYFSGYNWSYVPLSRLIKDNNLDNPDELSYHDEWANGEDEKGNPIYDISRFHYDPSKDNSRGDIIYATMKNGKLILANGKHRIRALANDGYTHANILIKESLNERYSTNIEPFDWKTGNVEGDKIFDTSTLGGFSGIADTIPGSKYHQYMIDKKNKIGKIVQMSPKEYFTIVALLFDSTFDDQIKQIEYDPEHIEKLKNVVLKDKKQFPMPFIDYTEKGSQEGRNRMYVAGELFGWDHKFPVLVVNWADFDKHLQDEKHVKERDLEFDTREALNKTLRLVGIRSIDEFMDELKGEFFKAERPWKISVNEKDKIFTVERDGVTIEISADQAYDKLIKEGVLKEGLAKDPDIGLLNLDIDGLNKILEDKFSHQFYFSDTPQDGPCYLIAEDSTTFPKSKFLYLGDASKDYLFPNMEIDYLVEIGQITQEEAYNINNSSTIRKYLYPYPLEETTLVLNDGFYRSEECIIRLPTVAPTKGQYEKLDEWLDHVRNKNNEVQVAYKNKDLNFITYDLTDPDIDNKYIIGRIKLSYVNHKLLP